MSNILLLVHTEADGSLARGALETAQAVSEIKQAGSGSELIIGLVGGEVETAAHALAVLEASRVIGVSGSDYGVSRYVTDAAAATALIQASEADIVIAAGSSRWSRALPGVATRVGGKIDTHVSGIVVEGGKIKAQRWYYRQRMMATLSREERPWIMLVDSGVFEPLEGAVGSVSVEQISAEVPVNGIRTEVSGIEAASADAQTIRPDASLLFVAGAGWTKKQADGEPHVGEAAELIKGFLGSADSSLGSSKSLVDLQTEGQETLSFMSHLNQVGQTGSTPRHPKGLATCCHGEEPHVVGWRFIGDRRAVNMDANCGWAQGKADVLYVADAFEVMQKVNEKLAQ